jgi:hypothetical protein
VRDHVAVKIRRRKCGIEVSRICVAGHRGEEVDVVSSDDARAFSSSKVQFLRTEFRRGLGNCNHLDCSSLLRMRCSVYATGSGSDGGRIVI